MIVNSLAFSGRDCAVNEILLLFWTHGPVIIDIVDDLRRNFNNGILFFRIELFEALCLVEDRHCRRWLGFTVFVQFLFFLIARDNSTFIKSTLSIHVDLVLFDGVGFISLPFVARVNQVLFPPLFAILLPLNLLLPVFLFLALENLATSDVQLATCNRCQEPLEELAKSNMVLLDIFGIDALDDSLAVVQRLVGQNLSTLRLPVQLVIHHGLRELVMFDHSDPLPMQFVGLWQTDIFTEGAGQEHQTLNDLRVALDAILEHILDHFDPLLIFQEFGGHHLESLVLVLNLG